MWIKFSSHLILPLLIHPALMIVGSLTESMVQLCCVQAGRNPWKARLRCRPVPLRSSPLGPEGAFWVVVSRYGMVCSDEELDFGVSSAFFQIPVLPLFFLFGEIHFLSFSFLIWKKRERLDGKASVSISCFCCCWKKTTASVIRKRKDLCSLILDSGDWAVPMILDVN